MFSNLKKYLLSLATVSTQSLRFLRHFYNLDWIRVLVRFKASRNQLTANRTYLCTYKVVRLTLLVTQPKTNVEAPRCQTLF
jgi:hypothetical protein